MHVCVWVCGCVGVWVGWREGKGKGGGLVMEARLDRECDGAFRV